MKSFPRVAMSRPVMARPIVRLRRILAARPWIHWLLVAAAGSAVVLSAVDHTRSVDEARAEWGATRSVWVAATDLEPGDVLAVEVRPFPSAMVPAVALGADIEQSIGGTVRQHVGAGEMLTVDDVAGGDGPSGLVPPGWLAVPVVETPASGASVGDRVEVASAGFAISADAVVVGHVDQSTLVAVIAHEAPALAAADEAGAITLLLAP